MDIFLRGNSHIDNLENTVPGFMVCSRSPILADRTR